MTHPSQQKNMAHQRKVNTQPCVLQQPSLGGLTILQNKLESLHPRCFVPTGSREDFLISLMYLFMSLSFYLRKEVGLSFEHSWLSFKKGYYVFSLVEFDQTVLENEIFKFRPCIFSFSLLNPLGKFEKKFMNSLYLRMLCVKFVWYWRSGSEKEGGNVKIRILTYVKKATKQVCMNFKQLHLFREMDRSIMIS